MRTNLKPNDVFQKFKSRFDTLISEPGITFPSYSLPFFVFVGGGYLDVPGS